MASECTWPLALLTTTKPRIARRHLWLHRLCGPSVSAARHRAATVLLLRADGAGYGCATYSTPNYSAPPGSATADLRSVPGSRSAAARAEHLIESATVWAKSGVKPLKRPRLTTGLYICHNYRIVIAR